MFPCYTGIHIGVQKDAASSSKEAVNSLQGSELNLDVKWLDWLVSSHRIVILMIFSCKETQYITLVSCQFRNCSPPQLLHQILDGAKPWCGDDLPINQVKFCKTSASWSCRFPAKTQQKTAFKIGHSLGRRAFACADLGGNWFTFATWKSYA